MKEVVKFVYLIIFENLLINTILRKTGAKQDVRLQDVRLL